MQNISILTDTEDKLLALDELRQPLRPSRTVVSYDAVEDQVRRAEEQLQALQEQRERLERQKLEFEELSAKQRAFAEGKHKMAEFLANAVPDLADQAADSKRRSEFLFQMKEVFEQHLNVLNTIHPESWTEQNLRVEVERGMEALRETESEVERFEQRMANFSDGSMGSLSPSRVSSYAGGEFLRWCKIGFACALPLMVFLSIMLWVVFKIFGR